MQKYTVFFFMIYYTARLFAQRYLYNYAERVWPSHYSNCHSCLPRGSNTEVLKHKMKLIIFLTLCIALGANAALIRGSGASGPEGAASAVVNCTGGASGKVPEGCGKVIPEPTWSPKLVVKSTNYMDVDPQDFAKVTHERETKSNATLAKNLKNLMLEDRKSNCIGTGRDCNLDNHREVDQDK